MCADQMPEFDTKDRERVYKFIRNRGPISPAQLRGAEVLPMGPGRSWQILAILKRDGYVTEVEGMLRDDYQPGESERLRVEDVDVRVREARLDDLSGLAGVVRQVIEGETYIVGETIRDQLADADTLLHGDSASTPMYFVALVDGEVIGWVHLEGRAVEKLDGVVYLTMGLLDEYRGLGIGSRLMQRACAWANHYGYRKVSSNVPATNGSAIDFLRTNGWEQEATRPNHYEIDGDTVDEVLLSYRP
jgi:ribosomal protein S18 acetylase RimI-like enzyme